MRWGEVLYFMILLNFWNYEVQPIFFTQFEFVKMFDVKHKKFTIFITPRELKPSWFLRLNPFLSFWLKYFFKFQPSHKLRQEMWVVHIDVNVILAKFQQNSSYHRNLSIYLTPDFYLSRYYHVLLPIRFFHWLIKNITTRQIKFSTNRKIGLGREREV